MSNIYVNQNVVSAELSLQKQGSEGREQKSTSLL